MSHLSLSLRESIKSAFLNDNFGETSDIWSDSQCKLPLRVKLNAIRLVSSEGDIRSFNMLHWYDLHSFLISLGDAKWLTWFVKVTPTLLDLESKGIYEHIVQWLLYFRMPGFDNANILGHLLRCRNNSCNALANEAIPAHKFVELGHMHGVIDFVSLQVDDLNKLMKHTYWSRYINLIMDPEDDERFSPRLTDHQLKEILRISARSSFHVQRFVFRRVIIVQRSDIFLYILGRVFEKHSVWLLSLLLKGPAIIARFVSFSLYSSYPSPSVPLSAFF